MNNGIKEEMAFGLQKRISHVVIYIHWDHYL